MTDSLHFYLTNRTVYVRKKSGFIWQLKVEDVGQWAWTAHSPESFPLEDVLTKINSKKVKQIYFYLGAGLCKFMVFDLPLNLRDDAEKNAAAHAHMMQKLGLNSIDWQCAIDIQHHKKKAIVCAIPVKLRGVLETLAAKHKVNIASISPYINGVWNTFQKIKTSHDKTTFLAWEEDAFTVAVAKHGFIESISTLLHQQDGAMFEREINRIRVLFGSGLEVETRLACVGQVRPLVPKSHIGQLVNLTDLPATSTSTRPVDFSDLLFQSPAEVSV